MTKKRNSRKKTDLLTAKKDRVFMQDDVAGDRLRVFIERIETLEKEKEALMLHVKETFDEAKGEGFDVKIIRQIIRIRKMKPEVREEQETMLDVYLRALESA